MVTARKRKSSSFSSLSLSVCLLGLPDDILLDVMHNWLNLIDLCNLETAVCVHGARGGFLQLLSTDRKNVLESEARAPPRSAFPWIGARRIKLHNLMITEDFEEEDFTALRGLVLDTDCIDRLRTLAVSGESYNEADLSH